MNPPDLSGLQGLVSFLSPESELNMEEFSYYAPNIWIKPPETSRSAATPTTFKFRLKTFLFAAAFKLKLSGCVSFLVNEHLGLVTPGDQCLGTLSWLVSSVYAARDICVIQAYTAHVHILNAFHFCKAP